MKTAEELPGIAEREQKKHYPYEGSYHHYLFANKWREGFIKGFEYAQFATPEPSADAYNSLQHKYILACKRIEELKKEVKILKESFAGFNGPEPSAVTEGEMERIIIDWTNHLIDLGAKFINPPASMQETYRKWLQSKQPKQPEGDMESRLVAMSDYKNQEYISALDLILRKSADKSISDTFFRGYANGVITETFDRHPPFFANEDEDFSNTNK